MYSQDDLILNQPLHASDEPKARCIHGRYELVHTVDKEKRQDMQMYDASVRAGTVDQRTEVFPPNAMHA